jgi:hypothetical protein
VWGSHFFLNVSLSEGCKPECWKEESRGGPQNPYVCPRVVNPSAGKGSPEGDPKIRPSVCSRVLNPSAGKGVWEDTFVCVRGF